MEIIMKDEIKNPKLNQFSFLENYNLDKETESPISTFFINYCNLTIKDYIFHKEAELEENGKTKKIFFFILKDRFMITSIFNQQMAEKSNPLIFTREYTSVYINNKRFMSVKLNQMNYLNIWKS